MDGLVIRAAQYVKRMRKSNGGQVELLYHIVLFARPEIESAERKAFQAGWERCIDLYEAGEIRGYMNEDFGKWKEDNK